MKQLFPACAGLLLLATNYPAKADTLPRADSHAPIGVMGEHFHKKGEWMLSYRSMFMDMDGNLNRGTSIAADEIATTQPNRFFGNPGQPPTLRIVPVNMSMQMHMLGLMHAPSDNITIMAMINVITKEMDHTTYQGGMGTATLGGFTTKTDGLGDSSISALIRLYERGQSRIHGIAGVAIPTGDIDKRDDILTPMNTRPTVRVPYPMQLGSGTWDPIVGVSYSGFGDAFSWGAQWKSTFRISDNDDGYRLGDAHRMTGWLSYSWHESISVSLRAVYLDRANISGIDPLIIGPVQTADPARQGGKRLDLGVGVNIAGYARLNGWRLAIEYLNPVSQSLDGPQLETDGTLIVGIQKSW